MCEFSQTFLTLLLPHLRNTHPTSLSFLPLLSGHVAYDCDLSMHTHLVSKYFLNLVIVRINRREQVVCLILLPHHFSGEDVGDLVGVKT